MRNQYRAWVALHDGDDVSAMSADAHRAPADRLRRARGAPARREALRRMERALHRRRLLLGAARARARKTALNHTSHLYEDKLLRDAAHRAPEEPARVLAAAAEPRHHLLQTPTVETADAAGAALRAAHAVPLHRVAGRRAELLRRHLLAPPEGRCRRAAHDAEARRPAQRRRRACRPSSSSSERTRSHRPRRLPPGRRAPRRRRIPVRRIRHRRRLRHRRRPAQLARGRRRGRAPARRLRAGRLRPRPPRRPAAREPAGVLHPLARAQRARRQHRADPRRAARGRVDLPDRPQRDRAWR